MFATEKELSALLGEVEKEFSQILAKADNTLAKSEDVSLVKAEDEKKDDKKDKPEAKDDKDKKPAAKEEASAPKQDAPPAAPSDNAPPADAALAAPAAEAQADAAPAAPAMEGHGYDEEDMAHMQAMYASMSREELIAHHDAVKAALDGMMQQQAAPAAPAPQASAPEMDKCGDMTMVKSEKDVVIEVKPETVEASKESEMLKSELASKEAKITELSKTLEAVTQFVTKLVEKKGAPQGKAITQLDTIAKSEVTPEKKDLSKQDIAAKLLAKASDPKLEKTDREAINAYYATGQINLTGISHLLN